MNILTRASEGSMEAFTNGFISLFETCLFHDFRLPVRWGLRENFLAMKKPAVI